MAVLRLLLGALVALFALIAGLFAAAVVLISAMVGFVAMLFRPKPDPRAPVQQPVPHQQPRMGSDGVIDIVATKVPDQPGRKATDS